MKISEFNNVRNAYGENELEIDFDDAKYGNSVCDIAILIANVFFSKRYGVDVDGNEFDTSTTESFEVRRDLIEEKL